MQPGKPVKQTAEPYRPKGKHLSQHPSHNKEIRITFSPNEMRKPQLNGILK